MYYNPSYTLHTDATTRQLDAVVRARRRCPPTAAKAGEQMGMYYTVTGEGNGWMSGGKANKGFTL